MRAGAGQERMRSDLAVEFCGPAARNGTATIRTIALRGDAIVRNAIAAALDHCLGATGATRVFPLAYHAGKIAGIDVAQAGLAADLDGAEQVFGSRVARAGHFVIAMERCDVPRNIS